MSIAASRMEAAIVEGSPNMRIHRGADGPSPDRQVIPPATVDASGSEPGVQASSGQGRGAPDAAEIQGYGVVTSISDEARAAAQKARKDWRPNIRYIFEQGLAFAHQAVDRRRLARAVRQQVEAEAVGQANRLAAMDAGQAHAAAVKAGEELRRSNPDRVA